MSKPNKTVAAFIAKQPRDPRVIAAQNERAAEDPMIIDMGKFQRGEMTAEEFQSKWDTK